MSSFSSLEDSWQRIRTEAIERAGSLTDLPRRAAVYHDLYRSSGKTHVFPLIAAHGAQWARSYFPAGRRLGRLLSMARVFSPRIRRQRLEQLDAFIAAFRDINRQVCIDTYTSWHFTQQFGQSAKASFFVPPVLLTALNVCHAAQKKRQTLSTQQKRQIFRAFFLHEQDTLVEPRVKDAVSAFDWPLVRFSALRPVVRFDYFHPLRVLFFRDFASRDSRIKNGLRAFDIAARTGWQKVEQSLDCYSPGPACEAPQIQVPCKEAIGVPLL